jgi:hypothetical protein
VLVLLAPISPRVIAGLDPAIHGERLLMKTLLLHSRRSVMDARVKPGHDADRVAHESAALSLL